MYSSSSPQEAAGDAIAGMRFGDDVFYSPKRPPPKGVYRYLTGAAHARQHASYDFAVVTTTLTPDDADAVQCHLVEPLVDHGLHVDVIEAVDGTYFILMVRAPDEIVVRHAKKLKLQMWLRCGNARELDATLLEDAGMNPADRIQVVDHLVREGAKITESAKHVRRVFPVHDAARNDELLTKYIASAKLEMEIQSDAFCAHVKTYFGEKVAFYFCFLDYYNKSLFPIALVGVLLTIARPFLGIVLYMRVLVVWGFLVSVVWSFWFLKSWLRKTKELNFNWRNNFNATFTVYPNPTFHGAPCTNPITGLPDLSYPGWKRYPTYAAVVLFMLVQIAIMMLFIAAWLTIFEGLKVRYPTTGLFSVQWWTILGGGIVFGLFVDVFQWNVVVTRAARLLTRWENWKTMEQYERSLIRKLFCMDFLNYYTWFFLLAFVYVIPGAGDWITNALNSILYKDPVNCCFGPHLHKASNVCLSCPSPWTGHHTVANPRQCIPCVGWITFDRAHLDLETLFLTPIIVTQGLNLLIAVGWPWCVRRRHHAVRARTDKQALSIVRDDESSKRAVLGALDYNESKHATLANDSRARFLSRGPYLEALLRLARDVLYQAEQPTYDPYEDYHCAAVQFGFVVMFSMLWPLMPLACLGINALKWRADGVRLVRTLQRPFPRKANGIGEWYVVLVVLACVGVVVYTALVFVSTGAAEFFVPECAETMVLGGAFRFGPSFACFSLTARIVMVLVTEHLLFVLIWIFWKTVGSVPRWLALEWQRQEYSFKRSLYEARSGELHLGAITAQHSSSSSHLDAMVAPRETTPLLLRKPSHTATTKALAEMWDGKDAA
ncbi:hypothetical protein SPRG_12753 [Saprolegnia parasitica CBS 223.65]|uniref:Anoctamin transmembrane domain-containing protein n=1 Tax=Saprolegnia parasitica (strain CBS 223.65) TaxID=695850 RepID=A0A067C033_SAPPC|nr:hypothetical protein SPRG_12753 [Saprolegnia parasitica CBS 223.65]KDO22470.1 hypothetical protein SPRG_12753 [Saprolegnia parasitica CBS 223.65]|eukprot:XP_012206857.1 hypothetical protein SPRG_12753 [Saprolegnia parasitica CBS 223.65]